MPGDFNAVRVAFAAGDVDAVLDALCALVAHGDRDLDDPGFDVLSLSPSIVFGATEAGLSRALDITRQLVERNKRSGLAWQMYAAALEAAGRWPDASAVHANSAQFGSGVFENHLRRALDRLIAATQAAGLAVSPELSSIADDDAQAARTAFAGTQQVPASALVVRAARLAYPGRNRFAVIGFRLGECVAWQALVFERNLNSSTVCGVRCRTDVGELAEFHGRTELADFLDARAAARLDQREIGVIDATLAILAGCEEAVPIATRWNLVMPIHGPYVPPGPAALHVQEIAGLADLTIKCTARARGVEIRTPGAGLRCPPETVEVVDRARFQALLPVIVDRVDRAVRARDAFFARELGAYALLASLESGVAQAGHGGALRRSFHAGAYPESWPAGNLTSDAWQVAAFNETDAGCSVAVGHIEPFVPASRAAFDARLPELVAEVVRIIAIPAPLSIHDRGRLRVTVPFAGFAAGEIVSVEDVSADREERLHVVLWSEGRGRVVLSEGSDGCDPPFFSNLEHYVERAR